MEVFNAAQAPRKEFIMNIVVEMYFVYLALTLGLTVWVAQTLHRNGRIFLVDAFHGDTHLADSVNHLLVVGFYLINIGYVAIALRYGDHPGTLQEAIEDLSTKVGFVMLILGGMHFFNLLVFSKMRRAGVRAGAERIAPPASAVPGEAINV